MVPATDPTEPEAASPGAVEVQVATAAVRSSTRGQVTVALDHSAGGVPHDPGGQAGAATRLGGPSPVHAGEAAPTSAESVIGDDGRAWLRGQTTVYPNAPIGRIDFRQAGRTYWCTGTLIDADTVLTAGHCVHDGLTGGAGWSTSVRFSPGAEGNRAPFGSCRSRELLTLPGWFETGSEFQDLGLVQLDCAIGETVGWFGYRTTLGRRGRTGIAVNVRGYPGDMAWGSLWTMRDRIRLSQRQMVFYAADTYGGQSGSPVFSLGNCNGTDGPCILAVHAYGTHAGGPHASLNHGPRLNEERTSLINAVAVA